MLTDFVRPRVAGTAMATNWPSFKPGSSGPLQGSRLVLADNVSVRPPREVRLEGKIHQLPLSSLSRSRRTAWIVAR